MPFNGVESFCSGFRVQGPLRLIVHRLQPLVLNLFVVNFVDGSTWLQTGCVFDRIIGMYRISLGG